MNSKHAIISFSQSEKVKSGLIWCSQCVQITQNMPQEQQQGAVKILRGLVTMIANEVQLARQASRDDVWLEVDKLLNTARVMIDSGVSQEAEYHFTQALSQVNSIGQRAMSALIDQGLLS